ncbi:hypothetical protein, partial [[Eubacterium] cellulosolvens]
VRDLELNYGENFSLPVTIDNHHPPVINFVKPTQGSTLMGVTEVQVLAKDSDLDRIGGGINTTCGVQFFISEDEEIWSSLGSGAPGSDDTYTVSLNTMVMPDGDYWLKVNVTDRDGLETEKIMKFKVDNPSRPPEVELLTKLNKTDLTGTVTVSAKAFDFDRDINNSGVTFYILSDTSPGCWQSIGNDSEPELNDNGEYIYSIEWDTILVPDDWYHLKACVNDTEWLLNESASSIIKVHNNNKNPPFIELITPTGGETLKESQMITVRVRDLEDDINSQGVDYYYSEDKVQWRFIGTIPKPRIADKEFFDLLWNTDTVPDGEYWLNASVADSTGARSWSVTEDSILIHNNMDNPPVVKITAPTRAEHINGTYKIQAAASDLENNIDKLGVVFFFSSDGEDWTALANAPLPVQVGGSVYELTWDTTQHNDGLYWLRAEVKDHDGLTDITKSEYFFIHNKLDNAPEISFFGPTTGEVNRTVRVNASVFDLEDNLNADGVRFYYSADKNTWHLIGKDPTGYPIEEGKKYYELIWDTLSVPDDIYWLKAEAKDLTNLVGSDISDDEIIIHNKKTNPPRITFKTPRVDFPLDPIQSIIVEVLDFDNDVESVSFYYSTDNENWVLIDSRLNPDKDRTYKTVWDTTRMYNGKYYLKVIATDRMGNLEEYTEGKFEITEGKIKKEETPEEFPYWVIIVIVIVVIMGIAILMLIRHQKRHEQELIEEVSQELQKARLLEPEGTTGIPQTQAPILPSIGSNVPTAMPETEQTYLPPMEASIHVLPPATESTMEPAMPELPEYEPDVETIEYYKKQVDTWKAEGYNVSTLEKMYGKDDRIFASGFSVFSANISRLKNISKKLAALNTQGHEALVNSIKAKLYDPDQALSTASEFRELEKNWVRRHMQSLLVPISPKLTCYYRKYYPRLR